MFTITVTHYDLAIGQALSIESPVIHPTVKQSTLANPQRIQRTVPNLLLETFWLKPTLGGCSINGWTTTIEASMPGSTIHLKYFLHQESLLPHRVDSSDSVSKGVTIFTLKDYKEFQGVKLPTKLRREDGMLPAPLYEMKYEINPDYDPTLRVHPPSVEAGPDVWHRPR